MTVKEIVPLWQHQREGVAQALKRGSFAFFFEQGTGKTLCTITTLRNLYAKAGRPLRTLVLCPAIVVPNWAEEFHRFSSCGDLVQMLQGDKAKRIKALAAEDRHIFITNFESLDMDGLFWKAVGKLKKIIQEFDVIVVDEAHRCKNSTAKRTKMLIRLADKAKHRFILTGTPILNSEMDIWAQFRILDGGRALGASFLAFRNEFFTDMNAGKPTHMYWPDWKPRPGCAEAIQERIKPQAMRVAKAECLDLPPLTTQRVLVPLEGDQRRHYDSMLKDYITFLGSKACTASMALTRALRLMQIASGFLPLDGDGGWEPFLSCPRETALGDLLEDYSLGGPVIVWAAFKANYEAIASVCLRKQLTYGFLTGNESQKQKDQAVQDFRAGRFRVLIAAPGAGGTGVNLIEAPTAIWYSRNFSLEHRLQSQARNYRGGSEMHAKITQIDLVSPGTIDEECFAALERKEAISENILAFSRRMLDNRKACR